MENFSRFNLRNEIISRKNSKLSYLKFIFNSGVPKESAKGLLRLTLTIMVLDITDWDTVSVFMALVLLDILAQPLLSLPGRRILPSDLPSSLLFTECWPITEF